MISVVNGYVCTCSCDVAKARRGVDPHPQTDGSQNPTKPNETKNGADPAVVFGGSLKATAPAASAAIQAASAVQTLPQGINLLV